MTEIRAFVAHSFTEDDSEVVSKLARWDLYRLFGFLWLIYPKFRFAIGGAGRR